jgi:hypothetical protein
LAEARVLAEGDDLSQGVLPPLEAWMAKLPPATRQGLERDIRAGLAALPASAQATPAPP